MSPPEFLDISRDLLFSLLGLLTYVLEFLGAFWRDSLALSSPLFLFYPAVLLSLYCLFVSAAKKRKCKDWRDNFATKDKKVAIKEKNISTAPLFLMFRHTKLRAIL
jgi:hypothetical protein